MTIWTNDMRTTHKLLWDIEIQMDHQISTWWPDLIEVNRKKRTSRIVDFAIPADCRVKLRERKKWDKYLDLSRELKTLWNMKVTVLPVVIGVLGTVIKGLVQGLEDFEIRGQVEAIHIAALLRSARILRKVLETWGHSNSREKPSANTGAKNSQNSKIIIKINKNDNYFFYQYFSIEIKENKEKLKFCFYSCCFN